MIASFLNTIRTYLMIYILVIADLSGCLQLVAFIFINLCEIVFVNQFMPFGKSFNGKGTPK